jgi:D-glutamate cyclase
VTGTVIEAIRDLIQEDVGNRGLATVPGGNLLTAFPDDFNQACKSLSRRKRPVVGIVTGFYIPHATPPAAETDGPLGALFLARALVPLGAKVVFITDPFCVEALTAGLSACDLEKQVRIVDLAPESPGVAREDYCRALARSAGPLTHLIALERVGPSHSLASMNAQREATADTVMAFRQEVTEEERDRCHSMRGVDITSHMRPAHLPFEWRSGWKQPPRTIGIGDGGNEIGMGKLPWRVIRDNIPRGGLVACRVATEQLIVCGVSNWGAYGLAAGVLHLRGAEVPAGLFDPRREQELLELMVEKGPLVDGVTGRQEATVDGLSFDRYAGILPRLGVLAGEDSSGGTSISDSS